jgi:hypothetical protein
MRSSNVMLASLGRVSLLFVSCVAAASCASPASPDGEGEPMIAEHALTRIANVQARFQVQDATAERGAIQHGRFRPILGASIARGFERGASHLTPILVKRTDGEAREASVALPVAANGATSLEDDRSQMRVSFALRGAKATPAATADGYVLYEHAYENADVIHRVTTEGTEDFVLFETKPSRESLTYDLDVSQVAGLRLVGDSLEMLDAAGTPTLRIDAPYVVDSKGVVHAAKLGVRNCAVDTSAAEPWGRAVTPPGSAACVVSVDWQDVSYPALVDPSWTTTGSLTSSRQRGTVGTRLASGKVLISGGNLYGSTASQVYDPATGTFASTGAQVLGRAWHSAALLPSGKVLLVGGAYYYNEEWWMYEYTPTTELYDPATGTFSAGPTASEPSVGVGLASGDVLLLGGETGASKVYKAATNTLVATGNGTPRYSPSMTLLSSGKVLVVGGWPGIWGSPVATAEIFDPAAGGGVGAYSATGSLARVRVGHCATAVPSGKVLITGGYGGGSTTQARETELFDPATGAFSMGPLMNQERSLHSATLLDNGRVLVVGSNYNDGKLSYHSNQEEFDPVLGSVVQTVSSIVIQEQHSATKLADGRVLVGPGGGGPGAVGSQFTIYDAGGSSPPPPPPPVCTAPSTPTSVTATTTLSKSIRLNWSAGSNPSGGFRIYRLQSGVFSLRASVAGSSRTWTDTGLTSNSTWTYHVKAWSDCNSNGAFNAGDLESTASNQVTGKAK